MIRLVAIDIDGTLLDSRWQLPDANRDAICAAVDAGVEVAIVTGRMYGFAQPIIGLLPCPVTAIVSNGAVVKSPDGATRCGTLCRAPWRSPCWTLPPSGPTARH